jgi:pyridinium-3,5-biscarboxylic acid mononucleotide sulfurtransferase
MQASLQDKKAKLARVLKSFDRLAVALSGGVDSAVLLAEARAVLGERVIALTARSPIHPQQDLADAKTLAAKMGVPHLIVDSHEIDHTDFLANTEQRCYICKKMVFGQLAEMAGQRGFSTLAHGANADDMGDYRPGMKAVRELGVTAPLLEAGLTKADIRQLARQRDLAVWNKPAMACLATRFPYGTPITLEKLERIRQAEQVLGSAGFQNCRVRCHGNVARIEVPSDQLSALFTDPLRQRIVDRLREIGFIHIAADLEGYVSGSMNRALDNV